jgi:hypothetical protein
MFSYCAGNRFFTEFASTMEVRTSIVEAQTFSLLQRLCLL